MQLICQHCGQPEPDWPEPQLEWSRVPAQFHVKRAIEVACTGKHSLAMLVPSGLEIDAASLAAWANDHGASTVVVTPCPCGNFGNPKRECTCDVELITKHRKSAAWQTAKCADMWIELAPLTTSQKLDTRPSEPAERVLARIAKAKLPDKPITIAELDEASRQLLAAVMRHLDLSAWQVNTVLNVATTIMALTCALQLHTAHLAEAIQYRQRS